MGLIISLFLVLLLWDEVINLIENFQSKGRVAEQVIILTNTQEPLYDENVNRPRVYPYSVVEGGVHTVQELRSAIWRDPVVADHYSNFKLDRARVIEAKADGQFHVSYRIGDDIFWTKRTLKVAKGERLITDGTNFTRTRCANMLSEVPPQKTSPDEPPPGVFDTPRLPPSEPTPFMPPSIIGQEPPTTALPPSDFPPFIPPSIIGQEPPTTALPPSGPSPFIPPVVIEEELPDPPGEGNSPSPVPEPPTLLLLGCGLIGLAGYMKFLKK